MILRVHWRPRLKTIVVVWNGRRFVRARHDTDRPHSVRIRVRRDADFVVLARVPQHHHVAALASAGQ
jgi:hypothetical protein